MHRRTSIVVAHRLVTVVAADRVCLLVGVRRAVGDPHAELVDRSELYATMVRQQVRGLLPRIGI